MKAIVEIIGSLLQRIKSCLEKIPQNNLDADFWQVSDNHFVPQPLNLFSFFYYYQDSFVHEPDFY